MRESYQTFEINMQEVPIPKSGCQTGAISRLLKNILVSTDLNFFVNEST